MPRTPTKRHPCALGMEWYTTPRLTPETPRSTCRRGTDSVPRGSVDRSCEDREAQSPRSIPRSTEAASKLTVVVTNLSARPVCAAPVLQPLHLSFHQSGGVLVCPEVCIRRRNIIFGRCDGLNEEAPCFGRFWRVLAARCPPLGTQPCRLSGCCYWS